MRAARSSRPLSRWCAAVGIALGLGGAAMPALAAGGEVAGDGGLAVERVVMLMRHGVRAPRHDPAMPEGTASQPWPRWPVAPAELTAHGERSVRLLGSYDRDAFAGLFRAGVCPGADLAIMSDTDQRTIATGYAWAAGFAPGCPITVAHGDPGTADPVFAAIRAGRAGYRPRRADRAVRSVVDERSLRSSEQALRPLLSRLNQILCGNEPRSDCGLGAGPGKIAKASPHREPRLSGPLQDGADAVQILTLEYAEGMPMDSVGWGRVSARDLAELGAMRAAAYRYNWRVPYLSAVFGGPIAEAMLDSLGSDDPGRARLLLMVGHDSNIAALAGLLDLHWQAAGFAKDDPTQGGALGFERLRDATGRHYVRAFYRSASLDAIRALAPTGTAGSYETAYLPIPGCESEVPDACPLDRFTEVMMARLAERERGN